MKKLGMVVLLASALLVGGALTAGAVPFFEATNVLWTATSDGTVGWLLIVNMDEGVSYNTLIVEAFTPVNIVDAECLIYSGGAVVATGLTDYLAQMANNFYRINLPVEVGYLDFVIVKLAARRAQPIALYQAVFAGL
ncbi:MAG: hypothetical protein AB1778_08695 [Candidatus Bipolaricaulota bacterium]